jgi:non-specific serine/threonine protein kinase
MTTGAVQRRSDLPVQLTPLVGRTDEIDAVLSLLAREDVRLLTLSGPGGIGKTRIALEVGQRLSSAYSGGVRVVLLAPIRDPDLVLPAIAQSLDVRELPGRSPLDSLADRLNEGRWLLILDNFEHLMPAAQEVAGLLATHGQLKVMVTSRARLHIQGEHEFVVPPLALPVEVDEPDQALEQNAAVQLFLQSARTLVPGLTLTGANGRAVAAICRKLDGLPLAIELAAARTKVLPPEAILGRLDRRLPLLTRGARDAPDRHRTMRDAIEWSYDLLSPEEQALFRRLSVFTGGFTLLEAETVASRAGVEEDGDPGPPLSAIDGLATLIDNSLLMQQELEGEPRFAMLETLREFGWEQLQERGELDAARNDHADYFIGFAEAALPRLRGAERGAWLERFERSHDNLRSALTWLCESSDSRRAAQLAGALWRFWWWRSHLDEGRQRLAEVLELPGAASLGAFYARVLTGRGALAETQGDYVEAEQSYEEAVEVWKALDDRNELALSLVFRWLVALNAEDEQRMTELSTESLELFQELGDQWGIAVSQLEQGVMAMVREDYATGERILQDAIAGFGAINDPWGLALSKGVLGNIKTGQGEYSSAMGYLRESLSALLAMDDHWGLATVLLSVARTATEQGQYEQVARISGAIHRLHTSLGALLKVPFRERYERNLLAAKSHLGSERFDQLLMEGSSMTPAEAVAAALEPVTTSPKASREQPDMLSQAYGSLSRREREVLRLVPGRTAKEIGQELFISESTVRTHIEHILNKLGLRNQKELIAFIYEHRLI